MHDMLRRRAAEFGLRFAAPEILSSSRLAILAAEHARDQGRHAEFSRGVFVAYFADRRDIGDRNVLAEVATAAGLDAEALLRSLQAEEHADRLVEAEAGARRLGITGVPTFFIARADGLSAVATPAGPEAAPATAGAQRIVGAQPLGVFRDALGKV